MDLSKFTESDLVEPAVLLTVVCEVVLKDPIVGLLKNLKVKGYTMRPVSGEDKLGQPMQWREGEATHVEIAAVMTKEVSDVVLHALKTHRGDHTILMYRQNVEALLDE